MDEKSKSKIVKSYDDSLSKYRRIAELGLDIDKFNSVVRMSSSFALNDFCVLCSSKHNEFLYNTMMGIGRYYSINEVVEMKNFIDDPDFNVTTEVTNPFYVNHLPNTLDRGNFVGRVSEFNGAIVSAIQSSYGGNKNELAVIRIKRLTLAPNVDRIYVSVHKVLQRDYLLLVDKLTKLFTAEYKVTPNINDNTSIRSEAIGELLDLTGDSDDILFSVDASNFYNYESLMKQLKMQYGIEIQDVYLSSNGNRCSHWTNEKTIILDNRKHINMNGVKNLLPFEVQRMTLKK